MHAFERFKRWSQEHFNPELRLARLEAEQISAEEATLNPYQQKILSDIRELAEHGASELWVHSLERVGSSGGFGGDPGIVLRQKVEEELHMIGVYQGTVKNRHGFSEPGCFYFVRSYRDGDREPQFEIRNSLIAKRMFEAVKARSPFLKESFELAFSRVAEVKPAGIAYDVVSIFESSSFQLMLREHGREAVTEGRRKVDQVGENGDARAAKGKLAPSNRKKGQ